MPGDTLTLALDGTILLGEFAQTMKHLADLVTVLSKEVAPEAKIDWFIDELQAGSAIATIRGESDSSEAIQRVSHAYLVIGRSLEARQPVPYSVRVQKQVLSLTSLLDGHITAMRFETYHGEATLSSRATDKNEQSAIIYSLGKLKGRVQTLTSRHDLRFTLYDSVLDRPVNCYVGEGEEERLRGIWGKTVLVAGRIARDRHTGLPLSIRSITEITLVSANERDDYKKAAGVIPWKGGQETADRILRRARDAS